MVCVKIVRIDILNESKKIFHFEIYVVAHEHTSATRVETANNRTEENTICVCVKLLI